MFWGVMICSPVEVHRCFEERTASIFSVSDVISNGQDASNNLRGAQAEQNLLSSCWLLAWRIFDHEDGGSTFLRNVNKRLPDYTTQDSSLYGMYLFAERILL
jgi:hypothetical protein